jgi:superfamily II DNA or RNA helicase
MMDYTQFIRGRSQWGEGTGFDVKSVPNWLYDFQSFLVRWSLAQGRSAIFADCGMGKTPMQLAWADQVVRRFNKPVLIVTPLAVGSQTVGEAEKFGVEAKQVRDGNCDGLAQVYVTNYEQLKKFDPSMFAGIVCDESSRVKDDSSETKAVVEEFMRTIHMRLMCTATAAPNDFWEVGTTSECLGLLGFRDMITKFFKQDNGDGHAWGRVKYRFKGHAENPFWSWVCSFARSLQRPSDLGFDDSRFVLPPLIEEITTVRTSKCRPGFLIPMAARDMREEKQERRATIVERCEMAVQKTIGHDGATALWCDLNPEGDLLEKMLPGSVQIKGSMPDDQKEEYLKAFSTGQVKWLITKPQIGAWGLNWQHCHNTVLFPTHSYEKYYQLIRRFWRYGQDHTVKAHIIISEGEENIIKSIERKKAQSAKMFERLVSHMKDSMRLVNSDQFPVKERKPSWL